VTPLDPNSPRALYLQLADELRQAIRRGEFPSGARLPSENDLIARHGASRPTIRQAIAALKAEGLVVTGQGRGTFVRARPLARLPFARFTAAARQPGLGPFEASLQRAGATGDVQLLGVTTERAPADLAIRLEVDEGASVITRRRRMRVQDVPVQLYDAYYPADLFAGTELEARTKIDGGIYAALERVGHAPGRATEEVGARAPTPEEAEALALSPGIPVLTVVRTTRDLDGRAVEVLYVVASAEVNVFLYEDLPLT